MDDTNYIHHRIDGLDKLAETLERIARTQEGLLAIAAEAREERLRLSEKMKQHFKAGFAQEKGNE